MKRNIILFSCLLALLIASCKRTNNQGVISDSLMGTDTIQILHFSEETPYTELSYDNYIESVTYIPLDTCTKALLLNPSETYVRKVGNYFCVAYLHSDPKTAKLFKPDGSYVCDVFKIGRGPKELVNPSAYLVNDSLGTISFIEFKGEILQYNVNTSKIEKFSYPKIDDPSKGLARWGALNDGTYVASSLWPTSTDFDYNNLPYMYSLDKRFGVKERIYYPEDKKISQLSIAGVAEMPYEGWLISQTSNGVEFIDMYNDTVYKLHSGSKREPLYVVERDKKTMPSYDDNKKQRHKKNKYYYDKFLDSEKYFIMVYWHDGHRNTALWDKTTGECVLNESHQLRNHNYYCSLPFNFDGFQGWLPIEYITTDNVIYAIVDPLLFSKAPNYDDPESNVLLLKIQLK